MARFKFENQKEPNVVADDEVPACDEVGRPRAHRSFPSRTNHLSYEDPYEALNR